MVTPKEPKLGIANQYPAIVNIKIDISITKLVFSWLLKFSIIIKKHRENRVAKSPQVL